MNRIYSSINQAMYHNRAIIPYHLAGNGLGTTVRFSGFL